MNILYGINEKRFWVYIPGIGQTVDVPAYHREEYSPYVNRFMKTLGLSEEQFRSIMKLSSIEDALKNESILKLLAEKKLDPNWESLSDEDIDNIIIKCL